ncbi:MAG: MaoC family dehydratase N-terminal domain-containing protein [Gammaproteobacteria bacterium]|nr:MaoC family dehydratase N-terminal domain-containing protein [Gammaproteobacteria bacterium]MBK9427888.1 MaoC family dehydratase N-terminal domain-containing protein [Gammaproteobacteria bacterium]
MATVAQAPFPLTFGTYTDALKLVGQAGAKTVAEFSVTWEAIKVYCALVEDANPSYWDENYARRQWGGIVAPPGLLLSWCMALEWHPTKERKHYIMALRVPLPGDTLINVATSTEFDRHLYLGDRVSVQDRLVQISEEKDTRLGIGHFLTTEAEFLDQDGARVAVQTNQLFRYRTHEA